MSRGTCDEHMPAGVHQETSECRVFMAAPGLLRSEQKADVFYVCPDGSVFRSPDGEGRFYYDDLAQAREETIEDCPVVRLEHMPEDF